MTQNIKPWDTRGKLAYAQYIGIVEREAPTSLSGGSMSLDVIENEYEPLKKLLSKQFEKDI